MTTTITNFRTGMGNFVLYTPALQAIASMDPTGTLDICVDMDWHDPRKKSIVDICARLPFVNRVLGFPKDVEGRVGEYKTWFWNVWTSNGSAREFFSARHPYDYDKWNHHRMHESDYYMNIARMFYGYVGEKPKQLITPAEGPVVESKKKKIVLCNGSFGHIGCFKKWDYFPDLAKVLRQFYGDEICIIKVGYADELADVKDFDLDFVGKLTATETAKVLSQADLMVTTDTGNMHIADALGTPMVVIWGGSVVGKNQPINSPNKIIHLGLKCQPCIQTDAYRTCETFACVKDISVGEVMYNVRNFMSKGRFDD